MRVHWEEERRLQIVFRQGKTVTKVGSYDGHLANAGPYAMPDMADVIYVGRR